MGPLLLVLPLPLFPAACSGGGRSKQVLEVRVGQPSSVSSSTPSTPSTTPTSTSSSSKWGGEFLADSDTDDAVEPVESDEAADPELEFVELELESELVDGDPPPPPLISHAGRVAGLPQCRGPLSRMTKNVLSQH